QQLVDISNLRARYSMGGTGAGTPSAYAESMYRAQAAPQAAVQIGNLQRSFLEPLMQAMYGLTNRGTPQATSMVSPNSFMQVMSMLPGLAQGASSIRRAFPGGGGGGGGADASALQAMAPDTSGFDPSQLMQILPYLMGAA